MLKIENTVLINGTDCRVYHVGTILDLLDQEKDCIERLRKYSENSKALAKLKAKHETNIVELLKVLELHELKGE